ncbi:hypothetical protein [Kribbella solani]|uniref:Uncharacterized protein n=1 Tax=Kribbella solani TaxID=236067 RepID=A0A841DL09_9ACTN|nr:hypothetical protein [Kribbella solani]MBB5977360.1 hypothetical protein [Kribbella solani]
MVLIRVPVAVRRRLFRVAAVVAAVGGVAAVSTPAEARAVPAAPVAKVVVIGVPGLTWDVVKASPELTALVDEAQVGSITVKTAGPTTCPIDGWLTIGAGARSWGSVPGQGCGELPAVIDGRVAGWRTYVDRQAEHHTAAPLGRLGQISQGGQTARVGRGGQAICGFGAGAAVALARADGSVVDWQPEFDAARLASSRCGAAIVDGGALTKGDDAGRRIAGLVAQVRSSGGRVLLVGVGQQSADARRELQVVMQLAPETVAKQFVPGTVAKQLVPEGGRGWLTSASTRRPGLIQLSDVTATIVRERTPGTSDLAGVDDTGPLDGSPIRAAGERPADARAVIEDRLDFNQRFEQQRPRLIAVAMTILAAELLALAWFWLKCTPRSRRTLVFTLLTQCAFFVAVFLSTLTFWWRWPAPGFALYCVVLGGSAILAGLAQAVLKRDAFLGIASAAYLILLADGVLGTPLQFGSMFTDGPITGGRFYGFGNSTFATLAVAALVTAGAVAQRLIGSSRAQAAIAVLVIGGAAIVVDGWPGWGTDFGGIIALTPAVLLMAWLTWRSSVSLRALIGEGLAGLLAVAALAFVDYSRPVDSRSHFGTFVAKLLDGDASEVLIRKLEAAAQPFTGLSGWAMLAGVVLWIGATVLPGRVPFATYRRFYNELPMVRPTLLAVSACGLIGMLLNDAGVALPAIMVGFALPLLVAHLMVTGDRSASR